MTSRISWIKRYLKTKEKTWKSLWHYNVKTVFLDAPQCNFDADIIKKLNITSFYKGCMADYIKTLGWFCIYYTPTLNILLLQYNRIKNSYVI